VRSFGHKLLKGESQNLFKWERQKMFNAFGFGKILLAADLIIAGLGLLFMLSGKVPLGWLGRLPGDFSFKGKNFTF